MNKRKVIQSQASLDNQLHQLMILGDQNGLYDASDLICQLLERQEVNRIRRDEKLTKQLTLKSYALYHEITPGQAYRRFRRGEIPGAFSARGIITIPPNQLTPEVKARFDEEKADRAYRW